MGHEVAHMSSVYRETISDERLKAVTDHVRAWLFSPVRASAKAGEVGEPVPRLDERAEAHHEEPA
jgi:hypothetical protein